MTELTQTGIINLLRTNDKAVGRAVCVINENQTFDEQASETTKYHNGMGFRPVHAVMGTSCANYFTRNGWWRGTDRKGNMRVGIYWRQLIEAAKAKQGAKV